MEMRWTLFLAWGLIPYVDRAFPLSILRMGHYILRSYGLYAFRINYEPFCA